VHQVEFTERKSSHTGI